MLIYEILSILSIIISCFCAGFLRSSLNQLTECKSLLELKSDDFEKNLTEFNSTLKIASESNQSLGNMCKDLQNQIHVVDEKVSALGGGFKQGRTF